MKFILTALIIASIAVPQLAFAQQGIVCGIPGTVNCLIPCNGPDCDFGDLLQIFMNIMNFLIYLSIPVAALGFVTAGFYYITAGGEGGIGRAHKIFRNTAIGFMIILSAWVIVYTLTSSLLEEEFQGLGLVTSRMLS